MRYSNDPVIIERMRALEDAQKKADQSYAALTALLAERAKMYREMSDSIKNISDMITYARNLK